MTLRMIPNMNVLRPADARETVGAWKMALERKDGPSAILVTRQNLPVLDLSRSDIECGAYPVWEAEMASPSDLARVDRRSAPTPARRPRATGPPAAGWQHGPRRPELSACPSRCGNSRSPASQRARRRSSQPSAWPELPAARKRSRRRPPSQFFAATPHPRAAGRFGSAPRCLRLPYASRWPILRATSVAILWTTASFSKIDGTRRDTAPQIAISRAR